MKERADGHEGRPRDAFQTGILAMMAMMAICCISIVLIVALIPLIGWPAGIVLAIAGGAALMFVHGRLAGHGSHR